MGDRLIFLDIDGTLVGADAVVPDSAAEAIGKARANGHKVFICSGRSRCEMHDQILREPVDGIVGAAGAYVEIGGRVIYHHAIPQEQNHRLLEYFLSKDMAVLIETNENLYVNAICETYIDAYIAECEHNHIDYDSSLFDIARPLSVVSDPERLSINKLLYVTKRHDPAQIKADLQDAYTVVDSAINLPGRSGEVSELGMNKGNGVRIVADYYGMDLADTIGIGDGENDIGMLQTAGFGVAMGNANPALKEIADYVTTAVDRDGLYHAFSYLHLI